MTQKMWINEFKKYLYLLPQKEEKEILQYFDEVFADYHDQGYTDNEIVNELGDPKDVAKSMVSSYLDDNAEIEEGVREERSDKKEKFSSKIKRGVNSISNSFSNFCDNLSAKTRKKHAKLNRRERSDYEEEIESMRKQQEDYRRQVKEKEEEIEKVKRERDELKEERFRKEKEEMRREYVDIEYVPAPQYDYRRMKAKTYTKASRHSFLTNLIYFLIVLAFIAIGIATVCYSIVLLINDINRFIQAMSHFKSNSDKNFILSFGYHFIIVSAEVILIAIGIAIIQSCIKKLYRRFCVKKYIVEKRK